MTHRLARAATWTLIATILFAIMSLDGCKTNDGNPTDSPSAGFSKCLQHGDC